MTASSAVGRLSVLDLVSTVMDCAERPLDFTFLLRLERPVPIDALLAGAGSARNLYPTSGCLIDGKRWVRDPRASEFSIARDDDERVLDTFIDGPFDPATEACVKQLAVAASDGGTLLATRFHHALCDGVGAFMWLRHQLDVARGLMQPVVAPSAFRSVPLRRFDGHRRCKDKPRLPCRPSSTTVARPARARRRHMLEVAAEPLRRWAGACGGFTYSDLLATAVLEILAACGSDAGAPRRRIGLWLPVNVRRQPFTGFGNGSSRIRIRATDADRVPLAERCRATRRQIERARRNGEWAVPADPVLTRLPSRVMRFLMRTYLRRPWIDMGTAVFTHIERGGLSECSWAGDVRSIEIVGPLHRRHAFGITAATHRDRTFITFTYDPALVGGEDIARSANMLADELARPG